MNISIITAAYSVKYLDFTWESIKKQTHKEWEWIFVIDNSIEATEWYNSKFSSGDFAPYNVWSITVGKSQKRFGLPCRNIGAMAASYNRIIFLDDDNNFEEEDYLSEICRVELEEKKRAYTKLHILGKKPGSTFDRYKDTHPTRHHIDLGNLFYHKKDFLKYGYFDDSINKIMFDFDLIERIINGEGGLGNFTKVDRHLVFRHKRY